MLSGTEPLDALGLPLWPCHGYANGCACFRCADRADRTAALLSQGMPVDKATTTATFDSAEYIASLNLTAGETPRPLSPPREQNETRATVEPACSV